MKRLELLACLLAFLPASPALARHAPPEDFFVQTAREISKLSPRAHVKFVSVRSFTAANGGGSGAIGEGAAARLVGALVHEGRPGVLHAGLKVELPDAFVSGSYLPLGDRVQITITLTSAVSGRPLYTVWRVVPNEWGADGPRLGAGVRHRRLPKETVLGQEGVVDAAAAARVARGSCSDWQRRADSLQRAVLLPKARYWARRYWGAAPEKALAADPTRLISSPALKSEFERSLRFWLAQRQVPRLAPEEVRSMVNADLATETILDDCDDGLAALARR